MLRRSFLALPAAVALAPLAAPTVARAMTVPPIGAPAPGFTGRDSNGATVTMAQFSGKPVVLEWTNDGCPFVRKWYNSGGMQQLQRQAGAMGAVWLSVISSAPGEQGYVEGPRANDLTWERDAAPTHVLLDPDQKLGRLYGATVTPQIFIVDARGALVYSGGADSIASTRVEDMARATPYVRDALAALAAGKPIVHAVTRAYGCVVKYRNQV